MTLRIEALPLPLRLLALLPKAAPAAMPPKPAAAPEAQAHGTAAAGMAAPSIEMLVMLAAAPGAVGRKAALAQAGTGLDRLDRLRARLLRGGVPAAELAALTRWTEQIGIPDDADVAALLRDIEMRVLVELAKHERGD